MNNNNKEDSWSFGMGTEHDENTSNRVQLRLDFQDELIEDDFLCCCYNNDFISLFIIIAS
jgi:hypothetical protein